MYFFSNCGVVLSGVFYLADGWARSLAAQGEKNKRSNLSLDILNNSN